MNNSLKILAALIDYLERFQTEKGQEPKNVNEFTHWLNHHVFEPHNPLNNSTEEADVDMELTFLLIMQSKHYKTYCKEALVNSAVKSPDEYSFLYHLRLVDSFRKMELIHIHLLEAPSGIEVIKRLLKKGLIEEFDDKDDKRAKRIKITAKGIQEVSLVTPQMKSVYAKMVAKLSLSEKFNLLSVLKQLNDFHLSPKQKQN